MKKRTSSALAVCTAAVLLLSVLPGFTSETGRKLVGLWNAAPVSAAGASGYAQRYAFYSDGTFVFGSDEMDKAAIMLYQAGSWSIRGRTVVLQIDEEIFWNGSQENPVYIDKAVNYTREYSLSFLDGENSILIHNHKYYNFSQYPDLMDGFHIVKSLALSGVSYELKPDITFEASYTPNGEIRLSYPNGNIAAFTPQYKPLLLNGNLMACDIITVNDRTMVPIRMISQALGSQVNWDAVTQTITVKAIGRTIEMTVGSKNANVNNTSVTLDSPPMLHENRTYVPLRFVAEAFGMSISWNTRGFSQMSDGGFQIIPGVQGNVVIDVNLGSGGVPPISGEAALQIAKNAVSASFTLFKNEESTRQGVDITLLERAVADMAVIGEVSRYKIISGPKIFLVDKYTGTIFYEYTGDRNWGIRELTGGRNGFQIFY